MVRTIAINYMTEIILENSLLWLIPIAVVAGLVSGLLYFQGNNFTSQQRIPLLILRFLTLFFLGFLLLSPLLKSTVTREEKPILLWLEDHSLSMISGNDSLQVKRNLIEYQLPAALSEKYEIRHFDFSSGLEEPSDTFSGKSTNLYEALLESSDKYYNQNIGGMVLHTDGIANRGGNPSYIARSLSFPVFTVGYGDTTLQKDLFLEKVISNRVSYLNNNMPVEVYIRARQFTGNSATLKVRSDQGGVVYSQNININTDDYFERVNFFIKADKPGIQRYTVSLQELAGEVNSVNNVSSFAVEVFDNKRKIEILARGPHPDIGALNEALAELERYEVETKMAYEWDGNTANGDLYILHNPTAEMLNAIGKLKKPIWTIYGAETPTDAFEEVTGVKVESNSFEEVYPVLNQGFNLFNRDENYTLPLSEMPPLISPFGDITSAKPVYSLFTKKIGSVSTNSPLWFFTDDNNQRQALIMGTGIWRWRMYDYKANDNHEAFDRLLSKTVQYLTTDARKQRFVVDMPQRLEQGQVLRAEARLYNSSLELTNEPELKITFRNREGSEYDFSFAKAQNTYSLNAGRLPEGIYEYSSKVALGDETFSRKGSLVIEESHLEEADRVAKHFKLRQIASESGGSFYKADEMDALVERLVNNSSAKVFTYEETSTKSLINEKWIFALFVVFLAAEWALRKYFGKY